MRKTTQRKVERVARDVVIICISILVALYLSETNTLSYLRSFLGGLVALEAFVTGLFFTSLVTTPLSIVSFAEIAHYGNPILIAAFGAVGAVFGDILIFSILKHTLHADIRTFLKTPRHKKLPTVFKKRIFRWVTPFVGALIIASPLPDELGLSLLGFSRIGMRGLIAISFVMNFIGILAVVGISLAF